MTQHDDMPDDFWDGPLNDRAPDEPFTGDEHLRNDLLAMMREIETETQIECAHCSGIADGAIVVQTDTIARQALICTECAKNVLRWL